MVADLRAESDDLDGMEADLPADRWAEATPAPGWTVAHQVAHLLWTDRVALTAVTAEAGFSAVLAEAAEDPTGFVDAGAEELAVRPARPHCLTDWRHTRASSARRTAGRRQRPQAAVVRSADERRVDGHRPADGNLGAPSWTSPTRSG